MSTISGVTSSASSAATTTTSAYSSLDQSDFLNLLVKELEYQDPLNPVSNTEFIAQMAQFTSLEQTSEINTNLESLYANQSLNAGSALIGKTVVGTDTDGNSVSGTVSYVSVDDGEVYVGSGDTKIALDDISYVVDSEATSSTGTES